MAQVQDIVGDRLEGMQDAPSALRKNPERELSAAEAKTDAIALQELVSTKEPHIGWEAVKACCTFEKWSNLQLLSHQEDTQARLQLSDLLLDLSTEVGKLSGKDRYDLSEQVQEILAKLKAKGIDLHSEKEITKEQLLELKSSISAHLDQSRTKIQQVFAKMQTIIQFMNSVLDSAKRMVNDQSRLGQRICSNQRSGG